MRKIKGSVNYVLHSIGVVKTGCISDSNRINGETAMLLREALLCFAFLC